METEKNEKLGLWACVFFLTGGCIGSAIFSLSGMTMINGGPASILSWIAAALILVAYGLLVTELSIRYPKSGGVFVFPAKAIGNGWGFFSAWGYIISNIIAVSFSAITIGTFICAGLSPVTMGTVWQYQKVITLVAAVLTIFLASCLNLLDITSTGKVNNILVGILITVMLIYSAFAFASKGFNMENYRNFFNGAQGESGWIRSIPTAMVAYGACVAIAFMVGSVQNPRKTVPKSLLISMIVVTLLYLTMIFSTLGIVNWQTLQQEDGAFQPMFIAINHMGYDSGITTFLYLLIGVAGVLALITTILVVQALNARALQSMSEEGMMPAILSRTNRNGIPALSVVILSALSAILSCFSDTTSVLVNLGALTSAVTMVIVIVSYFVAYGKEELKKTDYRAPGGLVLAVVTMIIIVVSYVPSALASDAGSMWLFSAIIYAVGIVAFLIFKRKGTKNT